MKRFAAAFAIFLTPALAHGADVKAPVETIMKQVVINWNQDTGGEGEDYFDEADLGGTFSAAFAEAYRQAAKFPAFDEGSTPFDYDPITSSQDGCPIDHYDIVPGPVTDGKTDVKVSWKFWTCSDDEALKNSVTEVHFIVIMEKGKPVIEDVIRASEEDSGSLLREMQEIPEARKG